MKKIKRLSIIILMIATIIILSGKVEATTGKVNSETVRIRKEASTKSTILDQLDKGKEVEILEELEDWYKVKATIDGEKITGYISKDLLDVQKDSSNEVEQPETKTETQQPDKVEDSNQQIHNEGEITVTTNIEESKEYTLSQAISIKIVPLMNSRENAKIENGNVKVIEIINDWCKIENENDSGWVRTNTLKKSITTNENNIGTEPTDTNTTNTEEPQANENTSSTEKPEESNTTTVIKTGYVSAEGLKVRKKATTDSEELDSLKKNDKVSILEEVDGWYKIQLKDGIGYVSSKYISDTKVTETTSRGEETTRTGETVTSIEKKEDKIQNNNTIENNSNEKTTATGEAVVEYAKSYLGHKYISGGETPEKGFDCSGFTMYVYKHFGISLNRSSKDQIENGIAVERENLQKGDIVVFNGESNKTIGHVGIYIGGGEFIHASNPKGGVKITELSSSYYNTRYVGARRVI